MCLVHDDGTVLVQVRLPKRFPQENTVSHVLDERGLEGGWWREGEEKEEIGWKRRRGRKRRGRRGRKRGGRRGRDGRTSIQEMKLVNSNISFGWCCYLIRPKREECFKNPAANAQESIPTSVVERDEESLIITAGLFTQ